VPITLRAAVPADQPIIRRIVRHARLNPLNLHWQNFLIAEDGEEVIGIGQVKQYGDGSRELASIAVLPKWQGQGIGSLIIRALLAHETGPIVLICVDPLEAFYGRFGFRRAGSRHLPPALRSIYRLGLTLMLFSRLAGERIKLIAMVRP
jgi:N-acetylglutamate synthase-like GNAT family acetyltransferase